MTSTIHYKFRATTSFETISLPGSSARLFDIKRAIVKAKDLDKGNALDFDFKITNAMTKENYSDDTMLLPRGTRLIVSRLPAARGQGLVARFARADAGLSVQSAPTVRYGNPSAAESGYYTVQNRDEDEFVDANPNIYLNANVNANDLNSNLGVNNNAAASEAMTSASSTSKFTNINNNMNNTTAADNDDEEARLRAVIPGQNTGPSSIYGSNPMTRPAVQPPKFSSSMTSGSNSGTNNHHSNNKFKNNPLLLNPSNYTQRPNADPTLREMEQQQQQLDSNNKPKKKTGIPRTFHQPDDENGKAFETGFNQLLDRGGGHSESGLGKRMDLEYALQLTATSIPEHLQCGICGQVAKDALFIQWDEEGRTACDLCMRKGLSENRLRCPLTGQDGVSPDDLKPNKGLRKAVNVFVEDVMEKMSKIVKQQEVDDELEREEERKKAKSMNKEEDNINGYAGDTLERGDILKRGMIKKGVNKPVEDDFLGDDDFGGDVFDVIREEEETNEYEENPAEEQEKDVTNKYIDDDTRNGDNMKETEDNTISKNVAADDNVENPKNVGKNSDIVTTNAHSKNDVDSSSFLQSQQQRKIATTKSVQNRNEILNSNSPNQSQSNPRPVSPKISSHTVVNRREMLKHRGPPAGYVMGPAGANNTNQPPTSSNLGGRGNQHRNYQGRGRGQYNGGRGSGGHSYGGRGRGGGKHFKNGFQQQHNQYQNQNIEEFQQEHDPNSQDHGKGGTKRPRSDFENGSFQDSVDVDSIDSRSQSSHSDRNNYRGGRGRGFNGRLGGRGRGRGRGRGGRGREQGDFSHGNGGRGFDGWNNAPQGGRSNGYGPQGGYHGPPLGGRGRGPQGGRGFDDYGHQGGRGPPGGRGDFNPYGGRGGFNRGGRWGGNNFGRGRFHGRGRF